ncbi:MAG: chaperone modulator CbpM [Eudoraea sp.]|nr:chaperone modulator CbpM [Eudoraea sp.]
METPNYIRVRQFCSSHNIAESFVRILQEYEVIEIVEIDKELHLHEYELPKLEKMLRLHQDLEIDPQGLQVVHHLLEKLTSLQQEVVSLRKKLERFEEYY